MQVVLLVLVGFSVDYGALLLERTRLQNAADAASLAGARALVDGSNPGVSAAQAAATQYLDLHGYRVDGQTAISITFPPSPGTGALESVRIAVTRTRPTYFIRLVGITHVRTSPHYPQSNGKLERWHGSLKRECVRPTCPATLDEARRRCRRTPEAARWRKRRRTANRSNRRRLVPAPALRKPKSPASATVRRLNPWRQAG